jgi:alkaline phosphatase
MKTLKHFRTVILKATFFLGTCGTMGLIIPTPASAESPEQWFEDGSRAVKLSKRLEPNNNHARNVILFVGDGMGISTVTAARILDGQLQGENGEENRLSFEKFPYLALSKTYSVNQQTSDSAPTMTAMVTGVKTKDGLISVDEDVIRGEYATVAGNELTTILEIAEKQGKSTGVISTARITHATPAACYAHTADRDWEDDSNLPIDARTADFPDIARQLIEFPFGDGLEVALGGGRTRFLPDTAEDPEDAGSFGEREDGRDLTSEWLAKYTNSAFVWNRGQFDAIDPATTDHLLGLFERSHMEYEHDRLVDTAGEPSLSEMTIKAIDILAKNPNGYFLMVEAGRIDHAHHAGNAFRALVDTIEFANAVHLAREKTKGNRTLIIVTADHSHVFTIAGYPTRGNPILGKVLENDASGQPATDFALDALGLPYTTLSYANGPGYTGASDEQSEGSKSFPHFGEGYLGISNGRPDLTIVDTAIANYLQEATVPIASETHSGEDVAIYASGPHAHLFHGVQEQNVIYHVMAEAFNFPNTQQ